MKRLLARLALLWLVLSASLLLCFAQAGTTETLRPTVQVDDQTNAACSGLYNASTAMAGFIDSDPNTSTNQTSASINTQAKGRRFTTFATPSGTYSALTLTIKTSWTVGGTGASGIGNVQYSLNAGSNWTTVYNTGITRATTSDVITLSVAQDISQVMVRICTEADGDTVNISTATLAGFDIRTDGVLNASANAHRGTVHAQ